MGGNMKALIVALATWLCWSSVIVGSSRVCSDHQIKTNHYHNIFQPSNLTFYIDDPSTTAYSKFLKSLRKKLRCKKSHEIQVLCAIQEFNYFMVDLFYESLLLSLALNSTDLNLLAYKAGSKSYFFGNTDKLMPELFTGTDQFTMPLENSYISLGSRTAVEISMPALRSAFKYLNDYDSSPESIIKTSLIAVIEMVSEAARLKLIENTISNNLNENIRPGSKMISYMDKWDELSKQIQRSENGTFRQEVVLKNDDDTPFSAKSVDQVKENMGILKNYPPLEEYAVA